jgi:integrase
MSVSSYQKDGKVFWKVYLNIRSKSDSSFRKQRRVFELRSEKEAIAEERRLIQELSQEVAREEGKAKSWRNIIGLWEVAMREGRGGRAYENTTIIDYIARLHNWTTDWLDRPAHEITKGDARDVLRRVQEAGKTRKFQKTVKDTVNVIYDWAIEEHLIQGVHDSPMRGLELTASKEEKVPDILTLEEIRKLLFEAKHTEHRWYPIWAIALLTGMRNGELHALEWGDVDLENRRLTVSKSYHTRFKRVKSTKSGSWRTVPISDELLALLIDLKSKAGDRRHVLPRIGKWDSGFQAQVLRAFCLGIGIRSIRFHALRACFATQLLAHDIAPARIMKICGWEQLDTMQRYVRMAGIDERGATQVLRVMPSDDALAGEVVNLFEFKAKK